jgi:hypothetical protein
MMERPNTKYSDKFIERKPTTAWERDEAVAEYRNTVKYIEYLESKTLNQ